MASEYNQPSFMGKPINCNEENQSTVEILEALYVLTYQTSKKLERPIGIHVRIRLHPSMSKNQFTSRINKFFKKFGYKPPSVCVREEDPGEDGSHYHLALIIDGKRNRTLSVNFFLARLMKQGHLIDYKVINEQHHPYGLPLTSELGRDTYFKWVSYFAKKRTKQAGQQKVSKCKATERDIALWHEEGRKCLADRIGHTKAYGVASDISVPPLWGSIAPQMEPMQIDV